MKRYLLLFSLLIFITIVSRVAAQGTVISGKVRHANTYREIPSVNVYVKDTQIGTVTDIDGMFTLDTRNIAGNAILVFNHISFYTLEIPLAEARGQDIFNLKPRIIQLPAVSVEAQKIGPSVLKDIPQAYTIIDDRTFDARGYVDVGDLLKIEQSVQVEEELSGKKSISIRGGNADDVVILFNGIRMNNLYDNIFDLSRINLDDIKQLEIIRGSNTSLYGSEAISGVINIIPKIERNYKIRFQQKIGSYASGDWNLHLHHNFFERLNVSYSYRQAGYKRRYADSEVGGEGLFLENLNAYHNANLLYDLTGKDGDDPKTLSLAFFRSDLNYYNNRSDEELVNFSQMFVSRFVGDIFFIKNITLVGAYQWFDEHKDLEARTIFLDRIFKNRSSNFNIEKNIKLKNLEFLLTYQYEYNTLDFKDEMIYIDVGEISESISEAYLKRNKHSVASIIKYHATSADDIFNTADIDVSYRRDFVSDKVDDIIRQTSKLSEPFSIEDQTWDETMLKFSSNIGGQKDDLKFNGYLNFGGNYKFPTIIQQMSTPASIRQDIESNTMLNPEKNKNIELGLEFVKETPLNINLDGWSATANYFLNNYTNKIRMYYLPYSPIAFYDNVQNAKISGIELKFGLYFWEKKFTVEFGSSNYSIPERAAFPFKSEHKHILNLFFDHAGFSVKVNWFNESEQYAWIRSLEGEFLEVELPGYTNVDLHVSKHFDLFKFRFILNVSGRNLLDSDQELEGIAIRDRRYYLTFGVQY